MAKVLTKFVNNRVDKESIVADVNNTVKTTVELAKQSLEEAVNEALKKANINTQIHVVKDGNKTTVINGVVHEQFNNVLTLVKNDIPVFLSGAAGTGKNVLCKQVAEALDLDFYFTNAVTQEYKLTGFIDAMGTYHETEFYRAFKHGGVFFLDEIDASIPEVLVALNAAIANRYFEFPTGKINAHENFRVIAAGNTFGGGANNTYTGRYQLDAASLDRFSVIRVDYSREIEKSITHNNTALIDFAHRFREIVNSAGINCLCSYRSMIAITKLEGTLPLSEIFNITLVKGLNSEDVKTIQKWFNNTTNKYGLEFCKL